MHRDVEFLVRCYAVQPEAECEVDTGSDLRGQEAVTEVRGETVETVGVARGEVGVPTTRLVTKETLLYNQYI